MRWLILKLEEVHFKHVQTLRTWNSVYGKRRSFQLNLLMIANNTWSIFTLPFKFIGWICWVDLLSSSQTLKVFEVDKACWCQALIVVFLVYSPRETEPNGALTARNFCCQSIICERVQNISVLRTRENLLFLKCFLVWFEMCVSCGMPWPLIVGRRQDTTLCFLGYTSAVSSSVWLRFKQLRWFGSSSRRHYFEWWYCHFSTRGRDDVLLPECTWREQVLKQNFRHISRNPP